MQETTMKQIAREEVICSSETSVDFQRITRPYVPEYRILYNHGCENLKSFTIMTHFRPTSLPSPV
jgi:hypothetical protein